MILIVRSDSSYDRQLVGVLRQIRIQLGKPMAGFAMLCKLERAADRDMWKRQPSLQFTRDTGDSRQRTPMKSI